MNNKSIATEEWTYSYDIENHLTEIKKAGEFENKYLYDGDGNSVAQIERELGISPNLLSRWKARDDIAFDDQANKALFC